MSTQETTPAAAVDTSIPNGDVASAHAVNGDSTPKEPLNPAPFDKLPYKLDPNWKPEPGHVGNLTPEQEKALEELKEEIKKEGAWVEERMDDATVLRFLRARKWNVANAKTMFLSAEQWRKDFGVEELMNNFDFKEKEEVDKYYPQFYHKTDKQGRPIYIERLGFLDIKALNACTTTQRQLQRLVYEYEIFLRHRLPAASAAVGHPVETSCTILDLAGVSLSNFVKVRDYVNQATQIGQERYPEVMGKFYIVNAPWVFSTVWSVIKGWLDPVTIAKVKILGSGEKEWVVLREEIGVGAEEVLPASLGVGGRCRCVEYKEKEEGERKDGWCLGSDAGPWNPPKVKVQA
ncbi:cytosolic factor, phosphatidylinositol/phosphatidylcholine transfer protein [Stygiomarasmius scandens]|uniref:Cytosolic factor, phosphatidylinositol/phosphatidylcholine transfer protein n=1 Tax=Marasmiellus scandens TaxID=2682957 RepID=A0ABR1JHL5_9AGAR